MLQIKGATKIYGIIGYPVSHTRSPALHNAAFEALGIDAVYIPMQVAPENLKTAIAGIRSLGICGLNVTVPHKVAVMDYLDRIDESASEIGAVNTIVNRDGQLTGYNTDGIGFIKSLEKEGVEAAGKKVVMIGAGGAARAVAPALIAAGIETLTIINRTEEKVVSLAATLENHGTKITAMGLNNSQVDISIKCCNILVNTSSLGMKPGDGSPVCTELIHNEHILVDLIYNPPETPFLLAGRKADAKTINGYGMLVFQAAESFRLWTGVQPPVEIIWRAGLGIS